MFSISTHDRLCIADPEVIHLDRTIRKTHDNRTAESCTNAVSRLFDYVRIVGESQLEKKIRLHVRGTSSLVSIDVLRIATNLKRPCCLASVR